MMHHGTDPFAAPRAETAADRGPGSQLMGVAVSCGLLLLIGCVSFWLFDSLGSALLMMTLGMFLQPFYLYPLSRLLLRGGRSATARGLWLGAVLISGCLIFLGFFGFFLVLING